MKHLITLAITRFDETRGTIRRWRAGTHLLEEMGRHPEQIRSLADPIDDDIFNTIAEQLLDAGLADVVEGTGWIR